MKKARSKYALRVRRSKTGLGLFAEEEIKKGVRIIEYIGKRVRDDDGKNDDGKYFFDVGKNKIIDGNIKSNLARYINHSCVPNCEADGPEGRVFIISKRRIKEGEELTYNYGREYFKEHIEPRGCKCPKHSGSTKRTKPRRSSKSPKR